MCAPLGFLVFALGCAPAWHPARPGRLNLVVPDGWTVTRNYRAFGADTVVLDSDRASISVSVRPDSERGRQLPVDLVAGVRALSWGRGLGVQNAVIAEHDIELDGRRACAVTGMRRWRTANIGYTMIYSRAAGRSVELVLHAPLDELDRHAADWSTFIDGFHLDVPVPVDGPLFEDDLWRR
ncbi:MAG: hypothetical protein EXR71_02950 [Myxococcales bacterium]|nr:hypothetical protein [Myxococcales bacterium]